MRILALLLFASCAVAPHRPTPMRSVAMEATVAPAATVPPATVSNRPVPFYGAVPRIPGARILHAPRPCAHKDGLAPTVTIGPEPPAVGNLFTATFHTEGLLRADQHDERDAWMIMANRKLAEPLDMTIYGLPCFAMLPPEEVFYLPGSGKTIDLMRRPRHRGWIHISYQIPDLPWIIDHAFYMQLLVESPGSNRVGIVASPVLEVMVGR